jgi:hypothetical protein
MTDFQSVLSFPAKRCLWQTTKEKKSCSICEKSFIRTSFEMTASNKLSLPYYSPLKLGGTLK